MLKDDPENFCITRRQSLIKNYRNAIREELEIGAIVTLASLETNPINHPEILAYKARMLGGKANYGQYADWVDFIIHKYGPRKKCLSLGSGLGRIEKYLIENGFTADISTIEICSEVNEKVRLKDEQIQVNKGDLNFIELPENTFDFIICHGVLHHLINIEHVLGQIDQSLTQNGLVLIYEYVGPDRWQFPEATMHYLDEAFPRLSFSRREASSILGFESIRSSDILPILQETYGNGHFESVQYGGVYFPFVICAKKYDESDLKRAIHLDETDSADGQPAPCYHMGIYGKQKRRPPAALKWDDRQLAMRLPVHRMQSIRRKALRSLKSSRLGSGLIRRLKKADRSG